MQHIPAQLSEEATVTWLARDSSTAMDLWYNGLQYKHEDPKKLAIFETAGHENFPLLTDNPCGVNSKGKCR